MDLNLSSKRAVVCGSTQGIGKSAAMELALLGAHITLIARNEEKLKQVLLDLPKNAGQKHDYIIADFNLPDDLKLKVDSYAASNVVHILVNNTGGPPAGQAIDAKLEEFVRAFSNHLLCNQILTQSFVSGMKQAGYGRIINVISTSVKAPIKGLGVSNTIRGAVASWAKTLSLELGQFGITVNNVLPGTTMTARLAFVMNETAKKTGKTPDEVKKDMIAQIPIGRISEPQEVGAVIAFLCSPAAGYINGINVPVDGGRTSSL
ncbi:MAG TPA: SDR family oxidoreductase [Cyclobacteriaceae bacterium]|nr:SDR family oxidoreductase [Cyclobacteriaceae bacterium]